MTNNCFKLFFIVMILILVGCNKNTSHNELYAFLETNNQTDSLFNRSFEDCVNLLGQPDTIIVSPFNYYRPYVLDGNGHLEDGCEGVYVDEISRLQEHIPSFVFLSVIWYSDSSLKQDFVTISFLPRGNQMRSFYVKH